MYRYLEFKLRYLKTCFVCLFVCLFFLIRVSKNYYSLYFCEKNDGFSLFKIIFLRNWSLSTVGDFTVKNAKLGRKICIWTENWLSKNKMWCAADNNNNTSHTCVKGILDSILIQQLLTEYQFFTKFPQISHIHKYRIFKHNWRLIDELLLRYKVYGGGM